MGTCLSSATDDAHQAGPRGAKGGKRQVKKSEANKPVAKRAFTNINGEPSGGAKKKKNAAAAPNGRPKRVKNRTPPSHSATIPTPVAVPETKTLFQPDPGPLDPSDSHSSCRSARQRRERKEGDNPHSSTTTDTERSLPSLTDQTTGQFRSARTSIAEELLSAKSSVRVGNKPEPNPLAASHKSASADTLAASNKSADTLGASNKSGDAPGARNKSTESLGSSHTSALTAPGTDTAPVKPAPAPPQAPPPAAIEKKPIEPVGVVDRQRSRAGAMPEAPAKSAAPAQRTVTPAALRQNNGSQSCWVAIGGTVYDATRFASAHPGGMYCITSVAGKEADREFRKAHDTASAWAQLRKLPVVGSLQ